MSYDALFKGRSAERAEVVISTDEPQMASNLRKRRPFSSNPFKSTANLRHKTEANKKVSFLRGLLS